MVSSGKRFLVHAAPASATAETHGPDGDPRTGRGELATGIEPLLDAGSAGRLREVRRDELARRPELRVQFLAHVVTR